MHFTIFSQVIVLKSVLKKSWIKYSRLLRGYLTARVNNRKCLVNLIQAKMSGELLNYAFHCKIPVLTTWHWGVWSFHPLHITVSKEVGANWLKGWEDFCSVVRSSGVLPPPAYFVLVYLYFFLLLYFAI